MSNSADALRRWWGAFCLAVAGGMLIWGQTILKSRLDGVVFLVYWLLCFAFTISAMVFAMLDVLALRRRTREEQRKLVERTLGDVDAVQKEPPAQDER